jgi:hypothetical protein
MTPNETFDCDTKSSQSAHIFNMDNWIVKILFFSSASEAS